MVLDRGSFVKVHPILIDGLYVLLHVVAAAIIFGTGDSVSATSKFDQAKLSKSTSSDLVQSIGGGIKTVTTKDFGEEATLWAAKRDNPVIMENLDKFTIRAQHEEKRATMSLRSTESGNSRLRH